MREFTGGVATVETEGGTVGDVVRNLIERFPRMEWALLEGENLRPSVSVVINAEIASLGLFERVPPDAEVHFVPAMAGG